jgi:hypothetical protein
MGQTSSFSWKDIMLTHCAERTTKFKVSAENWIKCGGEDGVAHLQSDLTNSIQSLLRADWPRSVVCCQEAYFSLRWFVCFCELSLFCKFFCCPE